VRALALHADTLLVRSALLGVNCVVVRSGADTGAPTDERTFTGEPESAEAFVIDSPVLPEELDSLSALLEQAGYPPPSGLLATHGDWDHLLGRLAFPELALGCAESTAERLAASPGEAQRALRRFDEELAIERERPLALGSVQPLPVPGRCEIGARELELHPTAGHTSDGMAIVIPWAGVVVIGDYLSPIEIPTLEARTGVEARAGVEARTGVEAYLATLERLRPLVSAAEHVVPGHGPVCSRSRALELLEQDLDYLRALGGRGSVELPRGRRSAQQRALHQANLGSLAGASGG
jgi:glyoxylase-like metal-dependent hydrolase (beta-lactamase superfamily II)